MKNIDLTETIRMSTNIHDNLLVSLDPELSSGVNFVDAFTMWIDSNRDGFYIRDLDHIIQIMEKLEELVINDGYGVMEVLENFLDICCVVSKFVIKTFNFLML